jgi:hypothetical protein
MSAALARPLASPGWVLGRTDTMGLVNRPSVTPQLYNEARILIPT